MIPDALLWYFDGFTAFWRGAGHGMSHLLLIALIIWFLCGRRGRCGRRWRRSGMNRWRCDCRCGLCCCETSGEWDHPHARHHKEGDAETAE